MAYPAHTCQEPGCRKSASDAGPAPSGRRRTEKMVPTEMFTSMLEDPSSGSKSRRYLPHGYAGGMG